MVKDLNGVFEYTTNKNYKSILELDKRLTKAGIPHELAKLYDGWIIGYPNVNKGYKVFDVIEHEGSYGHEEDLMEAYGFGVEDVEVVDIDKAFTLFANVHFSTEVKKHDAIN